MEVKMKKETVSINGISMDVYSMNTIIVGTGAAGYNAADTLYSLGQKDIAILTEGINMGTSRNTGSDKQTYYKLTLSGDGLDSVTQMAETYFKGGSMHGDIALVEAALSARSFYKLVGAGVPFPHNKYGEYIGYKTDHDPRQRATSAGPLTSKFMTIKLEEQVNQKGITIFDGYLVVGILTDTDESGETKAIGLLTINMNSNDSNSMGFTLFNCTNIVYATGGPGGMYSTSVYPESQTGSSGIAFEAGAKGINLTESQYGIASIKFRWNLSGTYQQVIPRYISTDKDGNDEKEFLNEYFSDTGKMYDAIFLKGYQWPFDPRKVLDYGSSLIDILVYNETQVKGRRVFMDFTENPGKTEFDFSLLGKESYDYLKNSGALFGTPIERLFKMNEPAIDLYKNNGIDITKEYLEISVCAQHNNGGLLGNIWWESNVKHLFPVGEVNGVFGIYRPGGSALNSTQVGGLRAAQYINANYTQSPLDKETFSKKAAAQVMKKYDMARSFIQNGSNESNTMSERNRMKVRMTKLGAHIRTPDGADEGIKECIEDLKNFMNGTKASGLNDLPEAFRNWDILITQFVYLSAIKDYMSKGGKSRGSYLVSDRAGELPLSVLPENFRFSLDEGDLTTFTSETQLSISDDGSFDCKNEWIPARPIPADDNWFENVWNEYMKGNIIK